MEIYGIAGLSGSGKSTVAKKLEHFLSNSNIIIGDRLYLETIWEHRDDAHTLFGDNAFVKEGIMNSDLIWSQPEKYSQLKKIVLPEIRKKIIDLTKSNDNVTLLDWVYVPIMCDDCTKTILVEASPEIRHERLLQRSIFYAKQKAGIRDAIWGAMYNEFIPTFRIDNNDDESALTKQINELLPAFNTTAQ